MAGYTGQQDRPRNSYSTLSTNDTFGFTDSRSTSRASGNTFHSNLTSPSNYGSTPWSDNAYQHDESLPTPVTASSDHIHTAERPSSSRTPSSVPSTPLRAPRPTNRELQATNKHACSHCGTTFGKASDRSSHWKTSCQFLGDPDLPMDHPGDGEVCPECDHVARNTTKKKQHEKATKHSGTWDRISLSLNRRFASCDGSGIYDSTQAFFDRFQDRTFVYNHHSDEHFPMNHAHLRLGTLLQEGRSTSGSRHVSTYAALERHCSRHNLNEDDWQRIVANHTQKDAMKFAQKLEWGHRRPPDSAVLCRLGFTDLDKLIAKIVPPDFDQSIDAALPDSPTLPPQQEHSIVSDNFTLHADAASVEVLSHPLGAVYRSPQTAPSRYPAGQLRERSHLRVVNPSASASHRPPALAQTLLDSLHGHTLMQSMMHQDADNARMEKSTLLNNHAFNQRRLLYARPAPDLNLAAIAHDPAHSHSRPTGFAPETDTTSYGSSRMPIQGHAADSVGRSFDWDPQTTSMQPGCPKRPRPLSSAIHPEATIRSQSAPGRAPPTGWPQPQQQMQSGGIWIPMISDAPDGYAYSMRPQELELEVQIAEHKRESDRLIALQDLDRGRNAPANVYFATPPLPTTKTPNQKLRSFITKLARPSTQSSSFPTIAPDAPSSLSTRGLSGQGAAFKCPQCTTTSIGCLTGHLDHDRHQTKRAGGFLDTTKVQNAMRDMESVEFGDSEQLIQSDLSEHFPQLSQPPPTHSAEDILADERLLEADQPPGDSTEDWDEFFDVGDLEQLIQFDLTERSPGLSQLPGQSRDDILAEDPPGADQTPGDGTEDWSEQFFDVGDSEQLNQSDLKELFPELSQPR